MAIKINKPDILLAALLTGYLAGVPLFYPVVHVFLLGYLARRLLIKSDNDTAQTGPVLFESILLSIVLSTSTGLIIGSFFPLGSVATRIIFAAIMVMLRFYTKDTPQLQQLRIEPHTLYLFLVAAVPFLAIFIFNPSYGLISDAWWRCSILNQVGQYTLPPPNPWYAEVRLAYPYGYDAYLSLANPGLDCLWAYNLFAVATAFATLLAVYEIALMLHKDRRTAFTASASFLLLSHLGGLAFLYDAITMLPSLGIDGYLTFLKSVHGPHVHYGQLAFLNSWLIIPFQAASMMSSVHFMFLAFIMYFALRERWAFSGLGLGALVVSNPIAGAMAGMFLVIYIFLRDRGMRGIITNSLGAVLPTIPVAAVYAWAVFSKHAALATVVPESPTRIAGFLAGYCALILPTVYYLAGNRERNVRNIFVAGFLAFVLTAVAFSGRIDYIHTDIILFLSIGAAAFFSKALEAPVKNLHVSVLALLLSFPTLLVVGSYAYYKVPLAEEELAASGWIKENTPEKSVFLSSIRLYERENLSSAELTGSNLSRYVPQKMDIHMYAAVFGKRLLYFGDPGLLGVYKEDFREPMKVHQMVFAEGKACEGLYGRKIDYLYVNQKNKFFAEPLPECLGEVYRNDGVRIYKYNDNTSRYPCCAQLPDD